MAGLALGTATIGVTIRARVEANLRTTYYDYEAIVKGNLRTTTYDYEVMQSCLDSPKTPKL